MNTPLPSPPQPSQCEVAFEQMPWLVNGTLSTHEARELETHVALCARCQDRLTVERALFAAIRRPAGNVEQSPLPAWTRLEAAVAGLPAAASSPELAPGGSGAGTTLSPDPRPRQAVATVLPAVRNRHPLRLAMSLQAAAIVVLSTALLWMLAARTPGEPPAAYRTVATPDATLVAVDAAWRVVFDPATAPADPAAWLAAQGLRVLAGPSQDGVYTVAPLAGATPRIDALRADSRVRLVEPLGGAATTDARAAGTAP